MSSIACQKSWTMVVIDPLAPCAGIPGPIQLDAGFLAAVQFYHPTATGSLVQTLGNCYYEDSVVGNNVICNIYNGFGYFAITIKLPGFNYAYWTKDDSSATNPIGTYSWSPLGLGLGFGYPPGQATIT